MEYTNPTPTNLAGLPALQHHVHRCLDIWTVTQRILPCQLTPPTDQALEGIGNLPTMTPLI
jgi:hypothetical protein